MNLLITNTPEDQAYLILRSLRPYADRIIITLDGGSMFKRWSAMSAWSRQVDKRYRVPPCASNWRAGNLQVENSVEEERYVRRIEEVCALERIDFVFPSYDAEVYVFSKNKQRLAARGVTAVVPDFDGLTRILDKSLTLAAAEQAGFPIPRTRVVADRDGLREAADEIEPPWLLKPRCDAHAANIEVARDWPELEQAFQRLCQVTERPLLQEFVPSVTKRNYYVLVTPGGEVISILSPQVQRTRKIGVRTPCAAVRTTSEIPFEAEIRTMLGQLGVWGGLTIQSNVDARDGQPKLMEINPRFGHALWYRTELGINEPLIMLRLLQGEDPGPVPGFPENMLLLDPLWDIVHLMGQSLDQSLRWLRTTVTGRRAEAMPFAGEPLGALVRNLRQEYFGSGPRLTSPLNRGYLSDPLPPLSRVVRTFVETVRRRTS